MLDPAPPSLRRRGAATARARALADADGTLADEARRRGVVRRSRMHRLGARDGALPEGAVVVADWVVSPGRAAELRRELAAVVRRVSTPFDPGLTLTAAAQALDLPTTELVAALVEPPLRVEGGRVLPGDDGLPPGLARALEELAGDLDHTPFAAPDAGRLRELGLDPAAVGSLARAGHVLRVGETVLLPGADDRAVELLAGLPQPFTTSAAREALGTTRRVALPLLAHLDRTGRTVRLADDRRRVRTR